MNERQTKRDEANFLKLYETLPERERTFLDDFFGSTRLGTGGKLGYVQAVLSWNGRSETPVWQAEKANIKKWYRYMVDQGYAANTIFDYGLLLRRLTIHGKQREGLTKREARNVAEDLFDGAVPFTALRTEITNNQKWKDNIVTKEEFNALLRAAEHPRVRALLPTLYEGAFRISELLGTRIRDVSFHEKYAQVRIEGKTGERTIPLVKSIPYLRAWLQVHPDKHNPEAYIFVRVYGGQLKPIVRSSVNRLFWFLCKKAKTRHLHAHQFRHTRLTELANMGLGEYQLKSFAGWTASSRMAAIYVKMSGRTHTKPILSLEGVEIEEPGKEVVSPIEVRICPRCMSENEADALYCMRCSYVLDENLRKEQGHKIEETDKLMDTLLQHPKVREAFKEALMEIKKAS